MELGVQEVAVRLGVSPGRVRSMIAAGQLPARRVVGRWVLDSDLVDDGASRPPGRPFSPRVAWGLISLVERGEAPALDPAERSRLRQRLREHPDVGAVAVAARRRNRLHRFKAHAAALPRAKAWPGAVLAGASAGGHDVIDLAKVEIYLPDDEVERLVRLLRARPEEKDANLLVRVPQAQAWPFLHGQAEAGPVAVAFDLWETGDARSQRAARRIWSQELAAARFETSRA